MNDLQVFSNSQALAEAAADTIADQARRSIKARGQFYLVLAGGSTPEPTYRLLGKPPYRSQIDWSRVHVFWGDERCVPLEDEKSNYRMAWEALLAHVPIPATQIHRIPGELPAGDAAAVYQAALRAILGPNPRLDLILLGMGADGHTASLFPNSPALEVEDELAVAVHAPDQEVPWRVTLTLPVLNRARTVLFLVSGEEKAEALARVREGDEAMPAARVQVQSGEEVWLVTAVA